MYIMEWIEKQKDVIKNSLTVCFNETAINLYKKFGFIIEGVSKEHYRINGKYIDDMIMTKFQA